MGSQYLVHLTTENFDEVIQKADKPVIIDCWALWCKPCLAIAPLYEKLAEMYHDKIIFAKLDTDKNPEIASRLGIFSIPTFLVFKNGQLAGRWVGAHPDRLKRAVEELASEQ